MNIQKNKRQQSLPLILFMIMIIDYFPYLAIFLIILGMSVLSITPLKFSAPAPMAKRGTKLAEWLGPAHERRALWLIICLALEAIEESLLSRLAMSVVAYACSKYALSS